MAVELSVIVVGQVVQRRMPENAIFVMHLNHSQRRIILVSQPGIWIDVLQQRPFPLPLGILELLHHIHNAGSAFSRSPIRQLIVQIGRIAVVRRNDVRIEQRPRHINAVLFKNRKPFIPPVQLSFIEAPAAPRSRL